MAPQAGLLPYSWGHKLLSRTPRPRAQGLGTCLTPHEPRLQEVTHPSVDLDNTGWHREQLVKSQAPENQSPSWKEEGEEAGPGRGSGGQKGNHGSEF